MMLRTQASGEVVLNQGETPIARSTSITSLTSDRRLTGTLSSGRVTRTTVWAQSVAVTHVYNSSIRPRLYIAIAQQLLVSIQRNARKATLFPSFSRPYLSNGRAFGKVFVFRRPSVVCKGRIEAKRCEIGPRLSWITNKKSHFGFQMTWKSLHVGRPWNKVLRSVAVLWLNGKS